MKIKFGYIQNIESIPAECKGAGWIYFSEDDSSIYLDSGHGPIKFSGKELDLSEYFTKEEVESAINNKIPSLDGYVKQEYVDDRINSIEIPEVDLTGYATEEWVSGEIIKISTGGNIDLTGYATESYVNQKISEIDIPSLDGYASEEWVTNKIAEAELNEKDVDLSGYATKSDVEHVASLIPSLDDYVKIEDLPSIDHLATKDELSKIENKIPSLEGYATEEFVTDKIEKIEIDVNSIDLSAYATKEFVSESIPVIGNGLENIDNTVNIKLDSDSENFVSVSENGLKISGIQKSINDGLNNYLNTQDFTSKVVYLKEPEWESLKEQVESGNSSWENNVIYMVYSDD